MLGVHGVGEAEGTEAERGGGGGVPNLAHRAVFGDAEVDGGGACLGIGGFIGERNVQIRFDGVAIFVDGSVGGYQRAATDGGYGLILSLA